MAVFTVTHAQRVDDYAVIQTLEATDITIGQTIVVAGVGNSFDATYIVQAIPTFLFVGIGVQGDFLFDTKSPSRTKYLSNQTSTTIRDLQRLEP